MHILFISDNFYPESNALANRLYDHARFWVEQGHRVTVLTCAPNFPAGKVYSGYKNKWRQVEVLNGINIVRIKSYITANAGSLKRILDYGSFALHAMLQGLFIKHPDIVIGTSPQPFPVFSAWFVARMKRKPFVFELRDLWPESILAVGAMGRQNALLRFFGWAIKKMYHSADVIVSVTDSFKESLIVEEQVDADKVVVCKNGLNLNEIRPSKSVEEIRDKYGVKDKYLVGYVGTIGMAHAVQTIIDAAKANTNPDVHYVIMGAGANADYIEEQASILNNVTFIKAGNRQDALNVNNMLDAGIVHLRNTALFTTVIPSKIFEMMALGKPILMGVKGESREIVLEQAKAGVGFEPEDAISLNKAITLLQETTYDPQMVRQYVQQYFNREEIARKMLNEIEQRIKG